MSDRRLWVKIDRGYLDNPKMLDVLDASSTAPLMHLASILYCSQHLTDGHINPSVARRKVGGTKEDERTLIEAGMWHEAGHGCDRCPQPAEGKVYVHDYLEHNQTARQAEHVSQKRSEAAQKRWGSSSGVQSASKVDSNADANQMQRREEKRREDESKFATWYAAYPKKVGKGAAERAFKAALKKTDLETLTAGRDRYIAATRDTDPKFIANPATWLNGERWADETPDTSTPATDFSAWNTYKPNYDEDTA